MYKQILLFLGLKVELLFIKKWKWYESAFPNIGWKATWRYLKLAEENLKMPVWRYNDKCYLTNDKTVIDYAVDEFQTDGDVEVINFTKGMPYILYWTFYKYEFGKTKNRLKDIQFPKRIRI